MDILIVYQNLYKALAEIDQYMKYSPKNITWEVSCGFPKMSVERFEGARESIINHYYHCKVSNEYDRHYLYGLRFDKVIYLNGTYDTELLRFIESRRK